MIGRGDGEWGEGIGGPGIEEVSRIRKVGMGRKFAQVDGDKSEISLGC